MMIPMEVNPGADMMLTEEEIDPSFVQSARIFHFGTLSMTHEGVRKATKKAVKAAKENGCLISFDPNLRPPLWETLELAREQMEYGFTQCDILKISDNEIQFVTGKEDYDEGIACLQERYQIPLILLTMGKDGSRAYYKDLRVEQKGFSVKTIETTGAGDTFCGCSLGYLLDQVFGERLDRHYDELKWLYLELYPGKEQHFEDLCRNMEGFYRERKEALKKLDRERELHTDWYKKNDLLGMMMYTDAFAGSLAGVKDKLDYIASCNVNYLHLMPLLLSPKGRSDGGYAVADFRKVQPELGTMEDLEELTDAWQMRGAGVYGSLLFL